mmetsp:Transcript_48539/g.96759  ORF Transcript_48539/g.96759 Transcript_48539/m.96759 type:complete len:101 (+) Transcript_48539:292-594(+)
MSNHSHTCLSRAYLATKRVTVQSVLPSYGHGRSALCAMGWVGMLVFCDHSQAPSGRVGRLSRAADAPSTFAGTAPPSMKPCARVRAGEGMRGAQGGVEQA